jgi:hypothetical protein
MRSHELSFERGALAGCHAGLEQGILDREMGIPVPADRRKTCLLLCVEKYLTKNIKKLLTNDLLAGIFNLTINIKSLTKNV